MKRGTRNPPWRGTGAKRGIFLKACPESKSLAAVVPLAKGDHRGFPLRSDLPKPLLGKEGRNHDRVSGPSLRVPGCICMLFVACAVQAQVSTDAAKVVEEDIRDIRGPIHIPYPWVWIIYVVVGFAVIFLAFQIFRWWKKRRQTVRIKLPHEIALERLERAREWMNVEHAREYSIAVSDAVRLYIEDCFHERAAHLTTEEFLHNLLSQSSSPLAAYAAPLEDFLRHCDLAKFARWSLALPEMEAMHASAKKFVQETRTMSSEQ